MISRTCGFVSVGCMIFLLSGCDGSMGSGSTSSSTSSAQGCQDDATMKTKLGEIDQDITAGNDEEAEKDTIDLGEIVDLLPIQGADGKCTVNPAEWVRDCSYSPFESMRPSNLTCRPIADGVELVRLAIPELPEDNVIMTLRVINSRWNGPERVVERVGDDSLSRIALFTIVTTETENEDGTTTTEEHCELDDRHIEARGNYVFEKVVEFVAQTLQVSQPCTP